MGTIDHVASLAGVSKATVSRVINQRGNVHPDTVRAVRQAIDQAQYQLPRPRQERSGAVRRGRRQHAPSLSAYALLVPEIAGGLYPSLLGGFEVAAHEQYHQVIVCNTDDNVFKQGDDILQLIHKNVGGVAIVPVASAKTPPSHIEVLQDVGIPVVLLHRDVERVDAPLISLPLEEVGYRAGRALLERGHRRIALFTSAGSASADLHSRGLSRALAEVGLGLCDELACFCPGTIPLSLSTLEAAVEEGITRMWSLPESQRPTAIYVTYDTIAEVVFLKLLSHGLRVPADVSMLGFGSSQRAGAITGRLSAIVVDELAVGRLAVEILEQSRGEREDRNGAPRLVRGADMSLAEGETLGPPCRTTA